MSMIVFNYRLIKKLKIVESYDIEIIKKGFYDEKNIKI